MSLTIFDGQPGKNKEGIGVQVFMFIIKGLSSQWKNLPNVILNILCTILDKNLKKAIPQNSLQPVFDLSNVGNLHRFQIPGIIVSNCGHDILLLYVDCIEEALDEAGMQEWHWVVPDFHDEAILECNEQDAPTVAELMQGRAYELLNEKLQGRIPHSGDSCIGDSLVPFKLEE